MAYIKQKNSNCYLNLNGYVGELSAHPLIVDMSDKFEIVDTISENPDWMISNYDNNPVNREFEKYVKRKADGEEYHLRICAELRVAKLGGGLTQSQYDAIYAATAPTRNEIISGQWLSGLSEFEKVQGLLSANLYNRIHNDITNYISANY